MTRIPFRADHVSTVAGSDPDDIDRPNSEMYRDETLTFDLNHLEDERCERSASGQHSYIITGHYFKCICCGADGGMV